mgnify:FL=1
MFPESKIIASEALQCPTLLENGFGAHRIEGIGDKHVPWIHNIKNTDLVVAIDDNAVMEIMRVFNEPEGQKYLASLGLAEALVSKLHLLGFSGIANLLSAIKFAKYYELGEEDIVLTVLTDSMELYESRVVEIQKEKGKLTQLQAAAAFSRYLLGERTDNLIELSYQDRRRVHNLKYYTWVEQQGKTYEEILDQWYDPTYWTDVQGQAEEIDELIIDFNQRTGLL